MVSLIERNPKCTMFKSKSLAVYRTMNQGVETQHLFGGRVIESNMTLFVSESASRA